MGNFLVYLYTFPSGKQYCGMTGVSLKKRQSSSYGYRDCPALWAAIQKYGWHNRKEEIIADDLSQEEAEALEQKIIEDKQLLNNQYGYNCVPGGKYNHIKAITVLAHTPEILQERSEEYKQKYQENKTFREQLDNAREISSKVTSKPVACLDPITHQIVKTFSSGREAARFIFPNNRRASLQGIGTKTIHNGYYWIFVNEEIYQQYKDTKLTNSIYGTFKAGNFHIIEQWKDGKLINYFWRQTDAAETINRSPASIFDALSGKHKTCGGYEWKYFQEEANNA